jgi:hypothetical protein
VIIGFAGKKQVGKSTAAGFLVEAGFNRASFAGPLKEMLAVLLRNLGYLDAEIAYFEANKEEAIPRIWKSYRHLIQTLGTDWGRNMIHPSLWLMPFSKEGRVVVDDIRFDNEADLIRADGGLIIHVERGNGNHDPHASESGIKFKPGDFHIYNNASLDVLRVVVLSFAKAK